MMRRYRKRWRRARHKGLMPRTRMSQTWRKSMSPRPHPHPLVGGGRAWVREGHRGEGEASGGGRRLPGSPPTRRWWRFSSPVSAPSPMSGRCLAVTQYFLAMTDREQDALFVEIGTNDYVDAPVPWRDTHNSEASRSGKPSVINLESEED